MMRIVHCPSCGKPIKIMPNEYSMKMYFKCSKCTTKWSLTFDVGEKEMQRAHMLAEDYPD